MRKIWIILVFALGTLSGLAEKSHVVQKNETLGGIARKYGVSTSALQAINGISNPNLLYVGKKLKIPSGASSEITYVVKKGESLGSIASRFRVKTSTLALINRIERPDLIKVGQKLTVPVKGSTYSPPPSLLNSSTLKALNAIRPESGKWKRIVVHHSATPVDDALNMHRVHKARGMKNGLAYHFVISNGFIDRLYLQQHKLCHELMIGMIVLIKIKISLVWHILIFQAFPLKMVFEIFTHLIVHFMIKSY